MGIQLCDRVENIVGKGETARYEQLRYNVKNMYKRGYNYVIE